MDKNSGGAVTKTTVYNPVDVGGAMRVNDSLYYLLKDHFESASVVTDASGNIVGETRFFPYGETRFMAGVMYTDKLYASQHRIPCCSELDTTLKQNRL